MKNQMNILDESHLQVLSPIHGGQSLKEDTEHKIKSNQYLCCRAGLNTQPSHLPLPKVTAKTDLYS